LGIFDTKIELLDFLWAQKPTAQKYLAEFRSEEKNIDLEFFKTSTDLYFDKIPAGEVK
jgi:hypothetical protein